MKTAAELKAEYDRLQKTRERNVEAIAETQRTAAALKARRPAILARAELDGDQGAAAELAQLDREAADAARAEADLKALVEGVDERLGNVLSSLRRTALGELEVILGRLEKQRDDVGREARQDLQNETVIDRLVALERQLYSFNLSVYEATGDRRFHRNWKPEALFGDDAEIAGMVYQRYRRRHPSIQGAPALFSGDRCDTFKPVLELLKLATPATPGAVVNLT